MRHLDASVTPHAVPALLFGILACLLAAPVPSWAGDFERVPQDGTLQEAIDRISEGGIIEISDGAYPAPAGGFTITSGKRFTIRAAKDATVVLDGEGSELILLLSGPSAGSVGFERLTFRDGFSASIDHSAVTVDGAEAVFASCVFESNHYDVAGRGGGAVRAVNHSVVRFVNSRFENNTSKQWGGALYGEDATVEAVWSDFVGNQANLPGHGNLSAGGAILVFDSKLTLTRSRFENNQAGLAGAIYGAGEWLDPEPTGGEESTVVTIRDSTFVGNMAMPNPCCPLPFPATGGAVYIEDQARLNIRGSRFEENGANWGGALGSYRGLIDVVDSVFRGNRAVRQGSTPASGGTVIVNSSDRSDASTGNGAINRRPAALSMTRSLVQGRFGATGVAAEGGGCLFAGGDLARLNGSGVPQDGTAADNRAPVRFDGVIFADCDVDAATGGSGGAMSLSLVDLEMRSSMILDSDALGDNSNGGAVFSLNDNRLVFQDSTFARNTADKAGAGFLIVTGHIEVHDCLFLDNDVSPGVDEPLANSPGSALTTGLGDLTGEVEGSTFSGNSGIPIVDRDSLSGPFNEIVYNGNSIHSTSFGDLVYKNLAVGFGGLTVGQLNDLVLNRDGGSTTDKSQVDNVFLAAAPSIGQLVAAPAAIVEAAGAAAREPVARATGSDGTPTGGFLGYAWSGSSATLAGQNLAQKAGLFDVTQPGAYQLDVDGTPVDGVNVGSRPCSRDQIMCLRQERFLVEVDWQIPDGSQGRGRAVFSELESGIFYFFAPDNWEMLIKVLDGCAINDRFWVFAAATTNVEYTLRVTDTVTGLSTSYFNPLDTASPAITDTKALAACDGGGASSGAPTWPEPAVTAWDELTLQSNCTPSDTNLCLNGGRFKIEVDWITDANTGVGRVVPFGSDDSGLLYFFNGNNWEMLLKVLNGCGINNHFWVFSAATTNVGYTLKVTDTDNGTVKEYVNPLGVASDAITDTRAFATCP